MAPKGRKRAAAAEAKRPTSLLESWDAALGEQKKPRTSDESLLTLWRFRKVVKHLGVGCIAERWNLIEDTLQEVAHDVPRDEGFSKTHLLLLAWAPLLRFARSATSSSNLSEDLKTCESLVAPRLSEVLSVDAAESLEVEALVGWMTGFLADFLGVIVDPPQFEAQLSALVPNVLDCTYLTGMTLLASGALERCFGPTLTSLIQRKAICLVAKVDLVVPPTETLNDLISETLASRMPKQDGEARPVRNLRLARDKLGKAGFGAITQSMVELAVKTRQAIRHLPTTLVAAAQTLATAMQVTAPEEQERDLIDGLPLAGEWALRTHLLWADEALERWSADKIYKSRGVSFFGAGIATDESPPSQPRFRGLRFQVTIVYVPHIPPVETWEGEEKAPLSVDRYLLDVCHCQQKDGNYVAGVVQKQLARLGLSSADIVGGTGDRGGENEGFEDGVHAHFESYSPGYVRRRCLNHIAWTVCKAGLSECEDLCTSEICAYLNKGTTWSLLRAIATTTMAEGGLGLLRENGPRFKAIFGHAPGTILEDRPESAMTFLTWLRQGEREVILSQCAAQDLRQRTNLGQDAGKAVASLASLQSRLRRGIFAELLYRGLRLARVGNKAHRIAYDSTMRRVLQEATDYLTNLECTPAVALRLGLPLAGGRPWVEAYVRAHLATEDEVDDAMPLLNAFHLKIAGRMAAHLKLIGDNTNSSMWLAGAILSKDTAVAREAAVELVEHLCRTPARRRTSFEKTLFEDPSLWGGLESFSKHEPPTVVWGAKGLFAPLYRFLAPRFLANPDHVLDVERQHAVWQWVLQRRHSIKLKSLNAWLKLGDYLRDHENLPPHNELEPYLRESRQNFRRAYREHLAGGEVARGLVFDQMYHDRLGLSAAEAELLRGRAEVGELAPARNFAAAWSNYVRWTFVKGRFFSFPNLKPNLFLYVVDNKSLAGREPRERDDASGRALAVAWYETHFELGPDVVRRVDRTSEAMTLSMCSIAEILIVAGCVPPPADLASRDRELHLEDRYAEEERLVWKHEHLWQEADPWVFRLRNGDPAEMEYLVESPADKLAKMALARLLELTKGADRRRAYGLTVAALLAALVADD